VLKERKIDTLALYGAGGVGVRNELEKAVFSISTNLVRDEKGGRGLKCGNRKCRKAK